MDSAEKAARAKAAELRDQKRSRAAYNAAVTYPSTPMEPEPTIDDAAAMQALWKKQDADKAELQRETNRPIIRKPTFKKGGTVKGWGKARGARAAKIV